MAIHCSQSVPLSRQPVASGNSIEVSKAFAKQGYGKTRFGSLWETLPSLPNSLLPGFPTSFFYVRMYLSNSRSLSENQHSIAKSQPFREGSGSLLTGTLCLLPLMLGDFPRVFLKDLGELCPLVWEGQGPVWHSLALLSA